MSERAKAEGRSPQRLTVAVLLASVYGFCYRGYWVWSNSEHATGLHDGVGFYLSILHGVGPERFQDRPLVPVLAGLAYVHGVPFRYSFTVIDAIGLTAALLLGYRVLTLTRVYREAGVAMQWMGSAAYVALAFYLVAWQDWYKKPETDATAGFLMLLLLLWSARKASVWWSGAGILLVTVAAAFTRADAVLMMSVGMLVMAWMREHGALSLRRGAAVSVAAAAVVICCVVQLLLMKVIYPGARPYRAPLFMVSQNLWPPNEWVTFAGFVLPAAWTAWWVVRRRFREDAAGLGVLAGAAPFLLFWVLEGRIEEVRIFLPLALALAPLGVQMLMLLAGDSVAEGVVDKV